MLLQQVLKIKTKNIVVSIPACHAMSEPEDQTKRAIKLTNSDRQILVDLIEPLRDIIMMSKKDAATLRKKDSAWEKITVGFNANPTVSGHRTSLQLRKAWGNMCQRAKDDAAEVKKARLKTGGGPPEPDMSTLSANVAGVMGEALYPLDNPHDGDASHHGVQVIKLSSDSSEDSKPIDGTPKLAKPKFFFGHKRSIAATNGKSQATEDILAMRCAEHKAKMAKLAWETAYWRQKFTAEFGEEAAKKQEDIDI